MAQERIVRYVCVSLLLIISIMAVYNPNFAQAASNSNLSMVQIANGKIVNAQGTRVYFDGLNYKDQFKWQLYLKSGAPDWSGIKSDFAAMASLGARTVRVWFNWIYYAPQSGKLDSTRLISDIRKIADLGSQYKLYVIVTIYVKDLPSGGKNWLQADATTAKTDPNDPTFWLNDGTVQAGQRQQFVGLWSLISSRFKNEPAIAAYDLINEPYNKYYDVKPKWTTNVANADAHYPLKSLYDLVLAGIRTNGDRHLVILDYNWVYTYDLAPLARPASDSQVLYDIHMYYTANENSKQGWDTTYPELGPWKGYSSTGQSISYVYPDQTSGHDTTALSSRFGNLQQAQLKGYLFLIGEFGFTQNTSYSVDIARLTVQFNFSGFLYFEYSPDEAIGNAQVIQPIMTFNR